MAREHVHLIGIGGTGMTALAGLLQAAGCRVTGSDGRLYPPTSILLERLGLEVRVGFDPTNLRPAPDLVVVGNAISRGNPEAEEMLDRRLPFTSMPRLIEERFLPGRHSIVVAGTHGKTTTASMLAWVLHSAGRDPSYLIGGSPIDFDYPFRLGRGAAFVIEGDEYDTAFFDKGPKFMHYRPDTALVGTVEFDHADIYADLSQLKTAFARLVNLVPRRGLIVRHEDCPVTVEITGAAHSRVTGYGVESGSWRAVDYEENTDGARFAVLRDGEPFARPSLQVPGLHNVRNCLATIAAAAEQGLGAEEIEAGLATFRGVRRRLELRGEAGGVQVLDDFAHHPTAIAEALATMRRRGPTGRIWAVLEPRSWSLRRNVFQERLTEVFDPADEVIVAAVYEADAVPEELRLDVPRLVEDLRARGLSASFLAGPDEIVPRIAGEAGPGDVVVVMSNGGFGGLHVRLLEALGERVQAAERRS
jgi:UDP-N-acetylmuramate: L-alanyl-gamma-D-glutamyl-meso-diaminopimelate ligase